MRLRMRRLRDVRRRRVRLRMRWRLRRDVRRLVRLRVGRLCDVRLWVRGLHDVRSRLVNRRGVGFFGMMLRRLVGHGMLRVLAGVTLRRSR